MSSSLLNVAKRVVREAAKLGIEEAGARICGPTAWKAVQQVLLPVVAELERRYPKFLLVPEKLEEAEKDLANDQSLETLLHQQLATVHEGHREILSVLFRYEETLQSYRELFVKAMEEAERKDQSRHESVIAEIAGARADIAGLPAQIAQAAAQPALSIDEIYRQANGYQMDAMKWISARDPEAAAQRLSVGRALALGGLRREDDNARLLVTLGFIEKSEAQVSMLRRNPEGATENLAMAAKLFAKAMERDPANLDALNGMANVYYYGRDYDSAIELGLSIIETDPAHAPALTDLSLSLEEKIGESGPEPRLVDLLVTVYRALEQLMPRYPQMFPATYLAHVQKRLAYFGMIAGLGNLSFEEAMQRGYGFYGARDHGAALAAFDRAVSLQPDDADAHLLRGGALLYLGRSGDGLAAIDRTLALRPGYPAARSARGTALVGMGRVEAGIEELDRALAEWPGYPDAMYNKACAHALLGQADAAFDWLGQAIGANKEYRLTAMTDPHFDSLQRDAGGASRFQALMREQ